MASWANTTDYAKLYGAKYFGKSHAASSFLPDELIPLVQQFSDFAKCRNVTDIGAGSGLLTQELGRNGFQCLDLDYEPVGDGALHLDLSGPNETEQIEAIRNHFDSQQYISTCFDVLEHIDNEDIGHCLFNLNRLVSKYILVSISTRPSSRGNAYHSSVLPIETWHRLFEQCGFKAIQPFELDYKRRLAPLEKTDPTIQLVAEWSQANLFKDYELGEPTYYLFEKQEEIDFDASSVCVNEILDLNYKLEKREQFKIPADITIGLNIHHFQDFSNALPLIDAIPRNQLRVFVRDLSIIIRSDELDVITGFFKRNGVQTIVYQSIDELDVFISDLDFLLSFAESTVAINHIMSQNLVYKAKSLGVETVLFQHGIWIESFKNSILQFASSNLVTWGEEHINFIKNLEIESSHYVGAGSDLTGLNVLEFGNAKHADIVAPSNKDILKVFLNVETSQYENICLLGTNLDWGQHGISRDVVVQHLNEFISRNPETFFILKTHPSERVGSYQGLNHPNLMKIDEILMNCLNISYPRLIASVDIVVSSLSTLLLDGAIGGAKCLQYDTGNNLAYKFCSPISLNELGLVELPHFERYIPNGAFVGHYASANSNDFFDNLSKFLSNKPRPQISLSDVRNFYNASVIERLLIDKQNAIRPQAQPRIQEIQTLRQTVSKLSDEVQAIHQSRSWRITAPIRKVINLWG